jgi:hypothetical protein
MCIELHISSSPLVQRTANNHLVIKRLRDRHLLAPRVQFPRVPVSSRLRPGCHLATLSETDFVTTAPVIDDPATAKKRGWLPLLTVLFLLSYGLMTMLIVEQGQTIESQRALIRELFRDSTELSAVKKAAQESSQAPAAKTQPPVTRYPSTQNPSTQNPSTQAPNTHAPSSQAGPQQQRTQNHAGKQKPAFRMPSKPEPDLVDDVRTQITI